MLPPTSPESSHDTGPPSCDKTILPNFGPLPPPPPHRLTDRVLLEEPPSMQKSVVEGGMQMENAQSPRNTKILMNT